MIETKRVYDEKTPTKGYRILVDRLWPRGLKKEEVKADLWLKDVAPSSELRKWFGHDPKKWQKFQKSYFQELNQKKQAIDLIARKAQKGKVILLYGAKDSDHNQAVALKEYVEKILNN